jgi:hypothetical protein
MDAAKPIRNTAAYWILAASLGLVFLACLRPLSNADFFTHLAEGRAIAEAGLKGAPPLSFLADPAAPAPRPTWLYDLMVFRLERAGGAPAILISHALVFTLGFAWLALAALRRVDVLATAAIVLLSVWLALPVLVPGPTALAVLWVGFLLWFFSQPRPLFALPVVALLQLLAVNFGAASLATPFIVLLALFNLVLDVRLDGLQLTAEQRRYSIALAILFLAVTSLLFLSPGGELMASARAAMDSSVEVRYARAWTEPALALFPPSVFRHLGTLALLIGAMGLILMKQRLPLLVTVAAFVGAYLLVQASHLLLWFIALALPFLALSLQSIARAISSGFGNEARFRSRMSITGLLAVLTVVTALLTLTGNNPRTAHLPGGFGWRAPDGIHSTVAVRALRENGVLPERMFHLPFDGGPMAWELPGYRIFMDNRFDRYPIEATRCAVRMLNGEPAPATLAESWKVDALLLNCSWPQIPFSIQRSLKSSEWKLVYFDGISALLLRASSPLLAKVEASPVRSLGEKSIESEVARVESLLKSNQRPGFRPRLAGAAGLFNALGFDAEARKLYSLLLRASPDLLAPRIDYGFVLLRTGNAPLAELEFKRAIKMDSKNASAWRGLSLALVEQKRPDEARAAADRAERLKK